MVSRTNESKAWARTGATLFSLGATLVGCTGSNDVAGGRSALVAVCAQDATSVPASAWRCPDTLTVECDGGDGKASVDSVYVVNGQAGVTCTSDGVTVSDPGPFAVGTHAIAVNGAAVDGGTPSLCQAELVVVDTEAPVATTRTVTLWPPNHKMHTVVPDDCVEVVDACDGKLPVRFVSATSDEPENDLGDGNTAPDLVAACDAVQVRVERQGTGDGRVYRLAWEAQDHAGHRVTGTCQVVVPHDQGGRTPGEGPAVTTVQVTDGSACDTNPPG